MAQAHTQSHPDARTRLIHAAVRVFAIKNFEGATTREIAKLAEANIALIQYHFKGKEGLYLEALRWIFETGSAHMDKLPELAPPDAPQVRGRTVKALRAYLRIMVTSACITHRLMAEDHGPEVAEAAHQLWSREFVTLHPVARDFILEAITPFIEFLKGCIQRLRPDLSEQEGQFMGMSVQGQLMLLHNLPLIRHYRGTPFGEEDLEALVTHFTAFSLRGLGIPEAFPHPGV
nr:TetR family transcriptional regulator [uncultured Holophaga sp.]